MKKILFSTIGLTGLVFANFAKIGNIVTDSQTGLQWQDNTEASTVTEKNWVEAIKYCENLTLDGYSDWRLPNVNELKSIIDRSKKDPAIVDGFTNVKSGYYWSSTTTITHKRTAWYVDFNIGYINNDGNKANVDYYVRCVRAGQ